MTVFSGEPLPLAPRVDDKAEMENFHRKLLEYLRRLGAKLGSAEFNGGGGGGSVSISMIALGLSSDQGAPTSGVWTDVDWTQNIRTDPSVFSHDSGGSEPEKITVLADGTYLVFVDIERAEGGDFADYQTRLVGTDGNLLYGPSFNWADRQVIAPIPVSLFDGDWFKIQIKDTDGATQALLAGNGDTEPGTKMTVLYFPEFSNTTTPVTKGDPHPFFTP